MPPEPLPTRSPDSLEKAVLLRAKHVTVATRIFHRALFILDSGVPKNLTRLPLSPNKKFVFVELDPVSFKRLIHLSLNSSAVVTLKEDSSVSLHLIFNPAIIFVHACAITSIILGCGMVLLSWDSLLNQLLSREATLKGSKLCVFVGVGIFVAFCCACLLLYYFLYDVAVYFAIAIYFLLGTLAIAHVSAFWIQQFCADARKT
ncbi:unnamed protein product [Dicrocoelium dendriticum]|nr:unnamed protein product [Dicrocoelium dendriticum]